MPPRKLNIQQSADAQITNVWDPHVVADVNDAQVKVAKFGEVFDWHSHPDEDEAFFVLSGEIAIDFRDGVVDMGPGDFLMVPKGVEHRPRSRSQKPIVVMFEPAGTVNTGDASSDKTVVDLKRL